MDLVAELLLKGFHDAVVLCDTAGHHHVVAHTNAVAEAGNAARDGLVDAVDDVALVCAHGELRDDLALGKHRAGRADTDLLGRLVAKIAQFFDLHLKHAGHDIEEAAGTGCALVVHDEIFHHAVLDLDDLHVLPTDIDDRAHVREQERRALGVAGKLAHLHVGKAVKAVAPVARGKDEVHLLARHARVFQHLSDRAGWTRRARADSDEGLGNDLAAVF